MRIVVGRHINGIVLNDLEYLADDDGYLIEFTSAEKATEYLLENGCSEEELDYWFFEDLDAEDENDE